MARFAPAMIIGHMMPLGAGANGCLALSRTWQAAAGSGWVPPAGSQRSVQCFVAVPVPVTLMSRETLDAGAGPAAEPPGAAVLPHAVTRPAQAAAIMRFRAPA